MGRFRSSVTLCFRNMLETFISDELRAADKSFSKSTTSPPLCHVHGQKYVDSRYVTPGPQLVLDWDQSSSSRVNWNVSSYGNNEQTNCKPGRNNTNNTGVCTRGHPHTFGHF